MKYPNAPTSEELLNFLNLDLSKFKEVIDRIKEVKTDEQFFMGLSSIAIAKNLLKDALETVEGYEAEAKGLIKAKATALYGPDWKVIEAERFKIVRSFSGQLYEIVDEDNLDPDMVRVKFMPNSKNIETYREANDNTLPAGIAINEHRTEVIKVSVK